MKIWFSFAVVEKKILTLLEEMKAQIRQNTSMLSVVLRKMNEEDKNIDADLPQHIIFPLENMEEYDSLEDRLRNEDMMKRVVCVFCN